MGISFASARARAGDHMRFRAALGMAALALSSAGGMLIGCGGGGDLLLPRDAEPATVTLIDGDGQSGRVGEALPQLLIAEVTDAAGRPVAGATVAFVLNDPAPEASLDPDTVTTDADGRAATAMVLGTRPGTQAGEVRALGGSGTPTATIGFTHTALSESANGIRPVSGEDQSAPAGAKLGQPLVVEVADAFGNPIPGVAVTWTPEGGGSVGETSTSTGGDGRTAIERTLGTTSGTQRTLATVDGLAGSPVEFLHTATAGVASGVAIVSGDDQTGPVSTELTGDLIVEVRDAQNNPVPAVAVTWVVGTGGGSVTPTTSTTDTDGRASAAWTLGSSPGANTLSAVVSGIGVAQFSATATAGAPARLAIRTQPSPAVVSGDALAQQPVIQLLDAGGNEARQGGVVVRVAIASGGGTLGGTTEQGTDGDGRAGFTGLVISGAPGTHTLRFSADNFASVTSTQIVVGAAPTVTTIGSHNPDPSRPGEGVAVRFTVTSSNGTPTGTVRVREGAAECTGELSGGQGTCTIELTSNGIRTLTATYQPTGGFSASSDTESHTVRTPILVVARQPSSTAIVGTALDQQPVIQLEDGDGGDVTTSGVAVSAAIASGGGTLSGTTTRSTDGQGQAEFTNLVINGEPGPRTIVFTAGGFSSVTSSSISVQPAPPSSSKSSVAASPREITAGETSAITVTLKDAEGRALGGREVTLNGGSDPSVTPSSATSAGDGTAAFTFTSTLPETRNFDAASEGVPLGSVQVEVRAIGTTTAVAVASPEPWLSSTRVAVDVTVTAERSTPTGVVVVTSDKQGELCRQDVAVVRCEFSLQDRGNHTITAAYQGDGPFGASSASIKQKVEGRPDD